MFPAKKYFAVEGGKNEYGLTMILFYLFVV